MSGSRFIFRSGIFVFVLLSVVMFSCPVSAGPFQYSAQSWDDAPPVSDSKAPEPIGFWQVSPMVLVAVMLVVISPALVLPAEILIAGLSMVALNFRRVEEKTVLDHDLRGRIYRYIVENPGVCFTGIERGLDVNRGTLDYHLKILGREHRISVFTRNRRGFYFENSGKYTKEEMDILSLIRNDAELAICEYLLDYPGASRNEIMSVIQTTCSTVSWHMKRLVDSGIVKSTKNGRIVKYHLSSPATELIRDISGRTCA